MEDLSLAGLMHDRFTTFSGSVMSLERFLDQHLNGNGVLYIGTDSRNLHNTQFSTAVVSYTPGRGGVLLKMVRREQKIESLQQRLWKEAWYSVQLAMEVAQYTPDHVTIEIHLDVNASETHKSGKYAKALVGLVTSQGFDYRIKPDAWCASCIADRLVRSA